MFRGAPSGELRILGLRVKVSRLEVCFLFVRLSLFLQILLYQTPASTALVPLLALALQPAVVASSRVLHPLRRTLRAVSGTLQLV